MWDETIASNSTFMLQNIMPQFSVLYDIFFARPPIALSKRVFAAAAAFGLTRVDLLDSA